MWSSAPGGSGFHVVSVPFALKDASPERGATGPHRLKLPPT